MSTEAKWLGRIDYEKALVMQEDIVRGKIAGNATDHLLLLEHEPVYTIGRTSDQSSLREAAKLPHPVVQINRGGQATYHGPGQLVGYPILDLRNYGQDLHRYLRALEEILIETLRGYDVKGERREGLTGVWVGPRKIASIGVGVRQWISMHGFALNVCGDLAPFQQIIPCGISGVEMTSVERECGRPTGVKEVADRVAELFQQQLDHFLGSTNELESRSRPSAPERRDQA
ncbi:MAG TPA: lipoyl(octanoyl) transferase LipB [Chthoniobacteraceae bacterium]|nr:lipoyl(octanoyl) transferase LipB [Chthoniobacteraceae bacterium]